MDVAGSTLGEDDLAAQKTSSLLNALTGYSPLIYHVKPTSSYDQFIKQCRKVWASLRENKGSSMSESRSLTADLVSIISLHLRLEVY